MVQVAWNDKVSLTRAFQGAYAVFGVTLSFRKDNETTQGQNMVDACLADNVPLFIWSSLPSAKEESHGKWTTIRAFEEKSAVDRYIKAVGQPAVIFHTAMFTENLLEHAGGHQLVPVYPDKWEICYPMVPSNVRQPTTYVEKDVGPAVVAVINHWDDSHWRERLGKEPIPLCSYIITGKEMAETITQVTGKEVTYVTMTETVQEPIKSLFAFSAEYSYPYELPAPILLELGVKFHSFEDFVREKAVPFMKEMLKI
ncbi:NAD(P)-binding protein [Calocera viscosa TUFC12733]|uniref:NAD(P)-binding protein n=1 Tax=Calocera viscosa (strain TUFC12733) TaxID=1330018 RepID=A0A167KLP2_CALVF|nr:NAD(P)-binding protein [Calocera viscosa TUFC12733]